MAQLPFFKVGDFGQTIRRTIVDEKNDPVDLQTATLMEFHFKDPSGAVSTKNNTTHGVAFRTARAMTVRLSTWLRVPC